MPTMAFVRARVAQPNRVVSNQLPDWQTNLVRMFDAVLIEEV